MPSPKILAFAGSTRSGSFNKQLIRLAAEEARAAGAEVTLIDLRDLALPLFDQDLEAADGPPAGATELKRLMSSHEGLLIASPEYNSSVPGVLKNALDWASREAPGEPPLVAFRGKVAALLSASPGALGGLRGLIHLRAILANLGMIVLPDQAALPAAHEAFDEDGQLKDARRARQVAGVSRGLAEFLVRLSA